LPVVIAVQEYSALFYESSAKSGHNIDTSIIEMTRRVFSINKRFTLAYAALYGSVCFTFSVIIALKIAKGR